MELDGLSTWVTNAHREGILPKTGTSKNDWHDDKLDAVKGSKQAMGLMNMPTVDAERDGCIAAT